MKVVLADDHVLVLDGLRLCFEGESEFSVVGTCVNGKDLLELVRQEKPDIAIIDITMPGISGLDVIREITRMEEIETRCMVLSMHQEAEYVREAFGVGAKAYLVKSCPFEDLVQAARTVMNGKTFVSPEIAEILLKDMQTGAPDPASQLKDLTPREVQTLKLLAQGLSIKEIAFELGISYKTVHTFRSMLMQKLRIDNMAELIKFAIRRNLISMD